MVRTQIYLTERQHHELAAIARFAGKKQSILIRIEFLDLPSPVGRLSPGAGWHTHKAGFHCYQG